VTSHYYVETIPTETEGWRYVIRSGRPGAKRRLVIDTRAGYQTRSEAEGAAHAYLRRFLSRENPLKPSGAEVALVVAGVAAVGLVGYLIWNATQQPSSQTAGASSITGGGTTSLPPFTDGTPMPAAGNQYEAGAGANAPLVPTGS
jgi:hypothetical protein